MERYQVRIYGKPLTQLYEEIGANVARAADTSEAAMTAALGEALGSHLKRLDNCGTATFCDECAVLQPLMTGQGEVESFDRNLREDADRYQLFVPDLPSLLRELTDAAIGADAPIEAHRRVERAIRDCLAPYVYYNTECSHRRECQGAHELPLTARPR